jgi:hypothetical protein
MNAVVATFGLVDPYRRRAMIRARIVAAVLGLAVGVVICIALSGYDPSIRLTRGGAYAIAYSQTSEPVEVVRAWFWAYNHGDKLLQSRLGEDPHDDVPLDVICVGRVRENSPRRHEWSGVVMRGDVCIVPVSIRYRVTPQAYRRGVDGSEQDWEFHLKRGQSGRSWRILGRMVPD